MANKYKYFLLAFILSLGLDQGSKIAVRHFLRPMSQPVVRVIPGYFDLVYSENRGIAFSVLRDVSSVRPLIFLLAAVALVGIGLFLRRADPRWRRMAAELGLLAGGALGNVLDRLTVGPVTDFILWKVGVHRWPVFNIADAALVLGAIGMYLDLRREGRQAEEAEEAKAAEPAPAAPATLTGQQPGPLTT